MTLPLRRGAHAPSRAVVGALADHTRRPQHSPFGDRLAPHTDRRGRRSAHAGARMLPNSPCIQTGSDQSVRRKRCRRWKPFSLSWGRPSVYRARDQEATGAGGDPALFEPTPRDSLSPQRGEGRGEGCDQTNGPLVLRARDSSPRPSPRSRRRGSAGWTLRWVRLPTAFFSSRPTGGKHIRGSGPG